MKTTSFLIIVAILLVTGCNKKDGLPEPKPQPPVQKKPAIVSVSSDTPFYKKPAHLKVVVQNADSVFANGSFMENPLAYTTEDLAATTAFTLTARGKGGSVSQTYTVPVWSERMSIWCHDLVKVTKFRVCDVDSIQNPAAWQNLLGTIIVDYTKFNPDGSGYNVMNGAQLSFSGWSFKYGETIFSDRAYDWTIDSVTTKKLMYHRIAESPYQPGVFFRYEVEQTFKN